MISTMSNLRKRTVFCLDCPGLQAGKIFAILQRATFQAILTILSKNAPHIGTENKECARCSDGRRPIPRFPFWGRTCYRGGKSKAQG
jgi:hypothetical protein